MGRKRQKEQENDTAEQTAAKKKITGGKIAAVLIGIVAVVYLYFNVHVFYNFIKIIMKDPDAARQPGAVTEVLDEDLDEGYTQEEE